MESYDEVNAWLEGEEVDARTGEVVETETKTLKIVEKTPEDLLIAASDAARALERVIQLNERPPIMFNGKRYLEFHHWQTVGKFYHVTTRTLEPAPCEVFGVKGFRAKAEVIDEKTGLIVGGAEAYCMMDEPNWGKKPLFQLASMAQTRAASKALANKFRFVAIVAGYEGTPSEEMIHEKPEKPQVQMPKEKVSAPAAKQGVEPKDHHAAGTSSSPSESVAKDTRGELPGIPPPPLSKFFVRLHTLVRDKKIPEKNIKHAMKALCQKDSSKDLTDNECALLIRAIENGSIQ